MYILSIEELAAVNIASSKGGARYCLQGVVVERGDKSATLIATDGHRMHIIGDIEGEKGEIFIIPNEVVKRIILCAKSFKGEISRVLTLAVAITDKEWKIMTLLHSQYKELIGKEVKKLPDGDVLLSGAYKPIDGTFPNWRGVLPKKPEEPLQMEPFFLNAAYLADINKTRTLLGAEPAVEFDASAGPPQCPIRFRFPSRPRFHGIIMPMRG